MSEAPSSAAPWIYISYIRQDVGRDAERLATPLKLEFGRERVFLDTDLQAGDDWASVIEHALQACQVLLVLIGPGGLKQAGQFMRGEIGIALQRRLRVVPVLMPGATLPEPMELPVDLRPILEFQEVQVRRESFDVDVIRLIEALGKFLDQRSYGSPDQRFAPSSESLKSVASADVGAESDAEELSTKSYREASAIPPSISLLWHTALTTSLTHTRRRVAQVLHPLGGELLPAVTAWRATFWLALLALLLWGVVWPYVWPALMPAPAAVAATNEPLPAATGPVLPAGTRFRDCRDATCPWLRVLPAGSFTMGSPDDEPGRDKDEGPQHQVTVTRPFAVMETEVTVGLFKVFVAEMLYAVESGCWIWDGKESKNDPGTTWRKPFAASDQGDDHPVVCISWDTAQAFARWMTKRTGQPYRLLSEAEWEYAARAGNPAAYSFGADSNQICRYGNVADRRAKAEVPGVSGWTTAECDDGYAYTAPVGSFQPNAFGLYDMHGNAWEWVQDCQHDYSAAATTAVAIESTNCANRLLRGGGWVDNPRNARFAIRGPLVPSHRNLNVGFRLARMLP